MNYLIALRRSMESGHRENIISRSRSITSFIRSMKTIQQRPYFENNA